MTIGFELARIGIQVTNRVGPDTIGRGTEREERGKDRALALVVHE